MKVHFFNKTLSGGAAIGAIRQYESINRDGVDAKFFTGANTLVLPGQVYFDPWKSAGYITRAIKRISVSNFYRRIEEQTASLRGRYEKFTPADLPYKTPYPGEMPDIVHLQWVSDWLDLPSFIGSIPEHVPIFWTLHDMFPFTGGCHYTWGCDKLAQQCGNCPQLVHPAGNDLAAQAFLKKLETYKGRNMYMLANSTWMGDMAKQSKLFKETRLIETLHYPIDIDVYKPLDPITCKQNLGISTDAVVIAFGAESVQNYRKGFDLLIEAVKQMDTVGKDVELVYFGNKSETFEANCSFKVTHLGFIPSGIRQAEVYNAADIFVVPSREEAFGQTALESAACGTAVVTFNVGGLTDTVIHEKTGLLAEAVSAEALSKAIERLVNDTALREQLGVNGVQHAQNNFSMDGQGQKLIGLYNKALRETKG